MKWEELSSTRIAALPRETTCVMPLGAIEQHGPHLPVFTDWLIANALASQLDESCGRQLLVMPGPTVDPFGRASTLSTAPVDPRVFARG